jgi:hypothetical protein
MTSLSGARENGRDRLLLASNFTADHMPYKRINNPRVVSEMIDINGIFYVCRVYVAFMP